MYRALREISNNSLGQVKGKESNREILHWFSDNKENYDEGRNQDYKEMWRVEGGHPKNLTAPSPESLDKKNHRNEAQG